MENIHLKNKMKNITLITCKSIEKEIRKAIEINNLEQINLKFYHCDYLNKRNNKCKMSDILSQYNNYEDIILLINNSCILSQKSHNSTREYYSKHIENLYDLFLPQNLVEHYYNSGYYVLTSGGVEFWLKNIDAWGLNHDNLFKYTQKEFEKFLILDTNIGLNNEDLAIKLHKKVKLPYEILPVGLDFLEMYLTKIISEFRLRELKESSLDNIIQANKQIANYEIAFDMIKTLTQLKSEEEVINFIINIFETLFSPKSTIFATVKKNQIDLIKSNPSDKKLDLKRLKSFLTKDVEYLLVENNSFLLKLIYKGDCFGVISIEEIHFPKYISRYLSLAIITGRICALAINNARVYQKLENTLRMLKESNRDLEEFAYMISHDLKQPLTIIIGYLNLLKEIYKGKINRSPIKPLNEAINSSYSMNQMIDDILDYSRLSRKEENKKLLDLTNILNQVISNLKIKIKKTQAEIYSDELPQIFADETSMIQVFQNLIENSIKYRSEKRPKIIISSQEGEKYYTISMKDNGIGIDPKEQDKIFDVFYRSPATEEQDISGSGIGLSICKKIINRLGGEMWVESNQQQGSTFYFTIPKKF